LTAARPFFQDYWESSRAPRYSLIFVLPLVIAYEVLATMLSRGAGGLRNGADVILRSLFQNVLGERGPLILGTLLVAVCVFLFQRDLRAKGGDLRGRILLLMAAEAAVVAALFGIVVGVVTSRVLNPLAPLALAPQHALSLSEGLMVSLGAGVYEELLFRAILVSALAFFFGRVLGWSKTHASIVSVIAAATVFSLFHYVGPMGDQFRMQSFVFRMIAGVFFSALYVLRGFGITAWTHALYDVYLLV